VRAAILAALMFLGMASPDFSQILDISCSGVTEATTRAYPNGSIVMCWEWDIQFDSDIDGFWLFRSPSTSKNLKGMLGPFTKVATIPKDQRQFTLSGSKGTYTYFIASYKGTSLYSVASNQFRVIYTP